MIIDKETIKKILQLSALEADEKQLGVLTLQLSKILEHMKALDDIEVKGVEPMFFGCDEAHTLREDKVHDFDHVLIKKETNFIEKDLYSVPNIIEDEQ